MILRIISKSDKKVKAILRAVAVILFLHLSTPLPSLYSKRAPVSSIHVAHAVSHFVRESIGFTVIFEAWRMCGGDRGP
jgi:hypothetical protein